MRVVRRVVGALELLEREARHLDDARSRWKARSTRASAVGDVVHDLVERIAHGELRRGALAIGKPVALEASAEERDTRGFISMTIMRPVFGLTANCTFEPPVSTPIFSQDGERGRRACAGIPRSERVCAGATVMESPVWTPIASKFSMEHTMIPLSDACRA